MLRNDDDLAYIENRMIRMIYVCSFTKYFRAISFKLWSVHHLRQADPTPALILILCYYVYYYIGS